MAQTIWKGAVSFGLVSIPVRLYAATEERDVSFRQVHEPDGGRIRYKRVCEKDGEEVQYRDIAKGYELPDGRIVVLTADDFANLPLPSRKTIEVLQFVPAEQIDPAYFARTYYLQADGVGSKPYVLLRDALERVGRVAVVKVALRNRESLAMLRPKDGVLVLQTMLWPDEVRDSSFAAPAEDVDVRAQEVAMAESYIETLSEDFDPSAFSDDYRAALEELVAAKSSGEDVHELETAEPEQGTVVDLMAALKASVEAAKQRRAGGSSGSSGSGGSSGSAAADAEAEAAPAAPPAKKTAAKRTTAKKAAPAAGSDAPAKKSAKTAKSSTRATVKAAKETGKAPAKSTSRRKTA